MITVVTDVTQAVQRADAEAAAVSRFFSLVSMMHYNLYCRGILGELTDDQDSYWKQQSPPEPFTHTCDIYGGACTQGYSCIMT